MLWRNTPSVVVGVNQNPYAECDLAKMQQRKVSDGNAPQKMGKARARERENERGRAQCDTTEKGATACASLDLKNLENFALQVIGTLPSPSHLTSPSVTILKAPLGSHTCPARIAPNQPLRAPSSPLRSPLCGG